jgi:hypothetical protein
MGNDPVAHVIVRIQRRFFACMHARANGKAIAFFSVNPQDFRKSRHPARTPGRRRRLSAIHSIPCHGMTSTLAL